MGIRAYDTGSLPLSGGTLTGPLLLPDGSAATPSLALASGSDTGWFKGFGESWAYGVNGTPYLNLYSSEMRFASGEAVTWASGDPTATAADTGIARSAAGVLKVTNGSTGGGGLIVGMGSGSGTASVGGTYEKFVSATGVGNVGAGVDTLWSLTAIPANSFTANGDALVLTLVVKTGATANNKVVGVTVGGSQVDSSVFTTNNGAGTFTIYIARVDATHVNVSITGALTTSGVVISPNLAVADLTANTLAVVVTGTGVADNDVVLYSGIAEWKK